MNSGDSRVDPDTLTNPQDLAAGSEVSVVDRWIVSRLNRTALDVNRALETYQFHEAVSLIYHFFWDDFCDWYIELKKDEIIAGGSAASTRILSVIEQSLRMLHPFMPYLTEDLWQKLPGTSREFHNMAYADADPSIMLADFPMGDGALIDSDAEAEMTAVIDVIKKVRNIRSEMNISPSIRFAVHIAADPASQAVFAANKAQILKLARAETIVIGGDLEVPKASARAVTTHASVAVPLEGLIDFDKERERLSTQISKLQIEMDRLDGQLANAAFVDRAPVEKVAALRERSIELNGQIATLESNIDALA